MGPEGGRPGSHTQAVGHTCSGNLGIVTLRYIRSDMYTASAKKIFGRKMPPPPFGKRGPVLKHNGKSGTDRRGNQEWTIQRHW